MDGFAQPPMVRSFDRLRLTASGGVGLPSHVAHSNQGSPTTSLSMIPRPPLSRMRRQDATVAFICEGIAMFTRTALFCAALAASANAAAVDSALDPTFGIFSTGRNVVPVDAGDTNQDTVAEVLTAPDGSLYLVGTADTGSENRITLVHLLANGLVDTDFGTNGRYVGPSGTGNTAAVAAAFDAGGDIIVVGTRQRAAPDNTDFTVCKFRGAGVTQFSATNTACVTAAFDLPNGNDHDQPRDLAVLKDGRIVLVGSANNGAGIEEAALAVFRADGTPDPVFGTNGKTHTLKPGLKQQVLYSVLDGGQVLVVLGESAIDGANHAAIHMRFLSDTGDEFSYSPVNLGLQNGYAYFRDARFLKDGNIIAVGGGKTANNEIQGVIAKLNPSGYTVNDGWGGGDGVALLDSGDQVELTRVLEQSDGKLLVAGTRTPAGGASTELIVGRFTAGGSVDLTGFNITYGYRAVDFALPGSYDAGARLALQAGRPVLAGSVENSGGNYDFGVARLQNDLIFSNRFGSTPQDD